MIGSYLAAQAKRTVKLSAVVLPVSLLLFLALGLAAALFLTRGPFAEKKSRYGIAIVGDIQDSYLGFGIQAVRSLDDSRFVVDFITMTEKEASLALMRGEVDAVFTVPDDFMESILYGRNDVAITYMTGDSQKTVSALLMDAFADIASDLIVSSQAAIFGMQEILSAQDTDTATFRAITNELYLQLAGLVMTRTALAEVQELGFAEGSDPFTWYFYTILLFFCFLFGMSSAGVFLLRNQALPRWMRVRGIGAAAQILCEFPVYLLLMVICTAFPLFVMERVLTALGLSVSFPPFSALLPALLPVLLLAASLQFCLYEIVKSPVAVFLLQFFMATGMGYLSGYFYPPGFFPKTLRMIGELLPTGVALTWLKDALESAPSAGTVLGVALYASAAMTITILFRRREILTGGAL